MSGTRKFADVAKEALGKDTSDKLHKGLSTTDMRIVFEQLVEKSDKPWRFRWAKIKGRAYEHRKWDMKSFVGGVIRKRGQYVLMGKAKWNCDKHNAFVKRFKDAKNVSDAVEEYVKNEADGPPDHAMGINSDGEGIDCRLYDNTWTSPYKLFSVKNLTSSLVNATCCYNFELTEM